MAMITEYFDQAQLALASYAVDLSPGMSSADYISALGLAGMANTQARNFSSAYTVLAQSAPTFDGFSATLFLDNRTGQKTLAIRGTNNFLDFPTDIVDIAFLGGTFAQPQYASLKSFYQQLIAEGKLTSTENFNVSGHSLGGFLAQAFSVDYAQNVTKTFTYNAPGIGGVAALVLSWLGAAQNNIAVSNMINMQALGLSVTAGLGTLLGDVQEIFTEVQLNPLNNHRIEYLTDSLAVYSLFSKIDPSLDANPAVLATITDILKASSNLASNSLESAIAAIGKLYGKNYSAVETNREDLYKDLADLEAALPGTDTIISLPGKSADAMAALAKGSDVNAMAYRYALKVGNPFVVLGVDYSRHNENGGLNLYDPATGQGELTDKWLKDRSGYLVWLMRANVADASTLDGTIYNYHDPDNWELTDLAGNRTITVRGDKNGFPSEDPAIKVIFGTDNDDSSGLTGGIDDDRLYGGAGNDTLEGGAGDDYLEGNADNDSLKGGAGRDTLFGGTGDDTLEGGSDNDNLVGGKGTNTYVFNSGDGWDTIIDDNSDGEGRIQIGSDILTGGKETADGMGFWESTDAGKKYKYSLYTEADGSKTLNITSGTDHLFVKNFIDGKLGITLGVSAPVVSPPPQNTYTLSGYYSCFTWADNTSWSVTGSFSDNNIYGGSANDQLQGAAGTDIILGGDGDDRIYGDTVVAVDAAIAVASQYQTLSQIDFLSGGTGNDLLVGSNSNYMFGGAGSDTIIGGGYIDVVEGDGFISGQGDITGSIWQTPLTSFGLSYDNDKKKYTFYFEFEKDGVATWYGRLSNEDVNGGADTIVTGAGNDCALGQLGDDYLSLGSGDDFGIGGAGSDVVDGGDGNDHLFGDFNWDSGPAPDGETYDERLLRVGLEGQYHGNDIVYGGAGSDWIQGNGGDDVLEGGLGNDELEGDDGITPGAYHGKDLLEGGDGSDSLLGDGNDDTLFGGAGDDALVGDRITLDAQFHGNDLLDGGDGNDSLWGQGGNDTLIGGTGQDSLVGDDIDLEGQFHGNDLIDGGDGNDSLWGQGGNDTLLGGAGNDSLCGDESSLNGQFHGSDFLDGGDGNDSLWGQGGSDTLVGGGGDDYLVADDPGLDNQFQGNDVVDGGSGNDTLFGLGGNDTLIGGEGFDGFSGGTGDDTYVFQPGDGVRTVNGQIETIYDDGGDDTVRLDGVTTDSVKVSVTNGVSRLLVEYGQSDQLVVSNAGTDAIENFEIGGEKLKLSQLIGRYSATPINWYDASGYQFINGGYQDDTLYFLDHSIVSGGRGNDMLQGSGGNNTYLYSLGDGTDSIYDFSPKIDAQGQPSINVLRFGEGITLNDIKITAQTYAVSHGNLNIQIGSAGDQQVLIAGFDQTATGKIDRFEFADGISLGYVELLQSRGLDLYATSGDYTPLIGFEYVHNMNGSGGGDIYRVNYANNQVIEAADAGNDTVEASIDYQLAANVENLTLTGSALLGTGNGLNNQILGNSLDNTLNGLAGDDSLIGGDGNDFLDGGTGNDRLEGGKGNDTYKFGRGNGNDTIFNNDDDVVRGDTLLLDTLNSTDIRLEVQNGADLAIVIKDSGESITVKSFFSNDCYKIDAIKFASGTTWDRAAIQQNLSVYSAYGTANNDTLYGATTSSFIYGYAGNDALYGGGAADMLDGGDGNDYLSGGAGDDVLAGGAGNDNLQAGDGNDSLDGGAGNDTLNGGLGNDTYYFRRGSGVDTITRCVGAAPATLVLDGLNSSDIRAEIRGSDLVFSINATGESITVQSYFSGNQISLVKFGDGTTWDLAALTNNSAVYGTENSETLYAGSGGTRVIAYGGDDTLYGNAGNDSLVGGNGNDLLNGSDGNDSLSGDAGNDFLWGEGGQDSLYGGAGVDWLHGGTDDDVLDGGSENDSLYGEDGNDTLDGGAGNDTLDGGLGNDTFLFRKGSGNDSLNNYGDTGTGRIDKLVLEGLNAEDIQVELRSYFDVAFVIKETGESFTVSYFFADDRYKIDAVEFADGTTWGRTEIIDHMAVYGTPGADNLRGLNGMDARLYGQAGNDTLYGGVGNDYLDGGADDDYLSAQPGNDVLNGGAGNDTLYGDDGNDLLDAGSGDDSLFGDNGNDTLDGGVGNDSLTGGAGNDIYIFRRGNGTDVVNNYDANVGRFDTLVLENLKIDDLRVEKWGTDDLAFVIKDAGESIKLEHYFNSDAYKIDSVTFADGTTWDQAAIVSNVGVYGTPGDDALAALSGIGSRLYGYEGNDTLLGSSGNDTMSGGLGDDTYGVDNAGDVVTEDPNEGTDLVQSSVTYTLGANLENLTLTGFGAINGTGNELANILIGNGSDNVLDGGADADTLVGGTGNDTYVVDNIGDVVTENAGNGTDLVQSFLSYALGANVENLTLTGAGSINGTGNSLANVLTGNAGNNSLDGGAGDDTMAGGAGDDLYVVDSTGDVITEGANAGTDLVQSSVTYALAVNVENLTLTGTVSINGTGNSLNNVIMGNSGANTLDGGTGADTLIGGGGDDILIVDSVGDVVIENVGEGTDIVQASISYTLGANLEDLTLVGSSAINGTGNDLNNTITGNSGDNILDGGAGADTLVGGTGNDTYYVSTGDTVTEAASAGTDTVVSDVTWTLGSNLENLTLSGTAVIDGTGNTLNNILTGNSAANVLNGGTGADTLIGGLGDDLYVVDNVGDVITEAGSAGTDLVQSSVTYTLAANVENLTLTGTSAINGTGNTLNNVLIGNSGANVLDGGTGVDTMQGAAGNDTYVVDNVDDVIIENASEGTDLVQSSVTYTLATNVENLTLTGTSNINATGNAVANTLTGNTGNNVLDGGAGNDTMIGGAGNDTYIVDSTSDSITENASAGTDLVLASATYTLAANVENLTLTGAGAINGTGNTLNNLLIGNSAANTLTGGTGADTMQGGAGDDIYVVDDVGDVVTENAGEGTDLVQSSITYTLGANVENLTLTGATAINGTGNALANTLTGNTADNVLNGGAGADTLIGGTGNDTYVVDDVGDVITEGSSAGTDLVQASVTYTLATNVENLTLTGASAINGTGNTLANTLTGNAADNVLDGGTGADTLIGGAGNDTYVVDNVGDVVTEGASAGTDLVQSSVTYMLATNVENLTLTGTSALNGTGNTLANVLTGNSGINVLDGGTGADTMIGGAGNDTYVVDNIGDVVTENASEGTDLVQASVSYTLAANVENLTLTGSSSINGTGNTLDNVLTGNTGANTLTGGAGNDTYVVDNIGDTIIELAGEGTDLVQSSITYTLAANVENLTLTGTAAINGTGNELNNTLTGNSADNVLDGGAGTDTLIGGAGNDTYYVSTGDTVTEAASAGTDLVISDVTWTLGSNIENLTLTGAAAINGTGNTLANVLIGNSAINTLSGGTGADTMQGGAGDDIYVVDDVGDVVTENVGEGIDLVQSGITYTLTSSVEKLTLTGSTAINGTGNELDNVLVGNSGINSLTGGAGNDSLDGGTGADTLIGGLGDDVYTVDNALDVVTENAGEGTDLVNSSITLTLAANVEALVLSGSSTINGTGNALNNLVRGNTGNNILNGDLGNDILEGGAGNDTLTDTSGTAFFNAGAGTDTITGGASAELYLGGLGNDTYTTGAGNDVILFNKGDGQDTFATGGTGSDTLSLGGNFAYSDLTLSKSNLDLILKEGASDQITFKDWYATTPYKPVVNLQVIAEAMVGFNAGGGDPLLDQKVENFNFTNLVGAYDAARALNPTLVNWALTNALTSCQLAGSDTAALGGDLAYQYGKNGTLAGIGLTAATDVIGNANFGTQAQTLNPLANIQTGSVRLT
jgi:Ca2+-binding RTX toxin-like protein